MDYVVVSAAVRVLPNLVDKESPVFIILQNKHGLRDAGQLTGLFSCQHNDVAYTVELLSHGLFYAALCFEVLEEQPDIIKLPADGLHQRIYDRFLFELLYEVLLQQLNIVNHQ